MSEERPLAAPAIRQEKGNNEKKITKYPLLYIRWSRPRYQIEVRQFSVNVRQLPLVAKEEHWTPKFVLSGEDAEQLPFFLKRIKTGQQWGRCVRHGYLCVDCKAWTHLLNSHMHRNAYLVATVFNTEKCMRWASQECPRILDGNSRRSSWVRIWP